MSYLIKKRTFVVPGELIAKGDYISGRNTFKEEKKIYSSVIGVSNNIGRTVYVSALKGRYIPTVGDLVVGKIIDMRLGSWIVDINAPYLAILFTSEAVNHPFNARKEDMTKILDIGDLIFAKVVSFDRTRGPTLTIRESDLGKITKGHIVKMTPTKIPRLIGMKGSMINILKSETKCDITIGQNGVILVSGKNPELEALAIQMIYIIEEKAHTSGLTDHITEFVKKEKRDLNVKKKKK